MFSNSTCKHAGICGGCPLIQTPYQEQLKLKCGEVAKLLAPFYNGTLNITPSVSTKYFRNKIELSFTHQPVHKEPFNKKIKRDKTIALVFEQALGFRQKGRWDRAIKLEECLLFNDKLPYFVSKINQWAESKNLSFYDQHTHQGALRTLLMRQSFNGSGGMLVFISTEHFNTEGLINICKQIYPTFSVLTAINAGMSDANPLTEIKILEGSETIQEVLKIDEKEIIFNLSPQAFFQTNTKTANIMYQRVRDKVKQIKPEVLYDLYGGAGSFSLTNADIVKKCLCVECVAQAIDNGKENAKLNGIKNVQFYCAKTEDFLATNKLSTFKSLVILDPARAGVHPKACEILASSGVKNILYISCNPKTLAENLKVLTQNYKIKSAECFDFFPHTNHIETLAELELK